MKKIIEATVRITSVIQNLDANGLTDGEPEKSESRATGFLHYSDEGALITYTESTESGNLTSEIELTDGKVRVRRSGAIESELIFEEGVTHTSLYRIPPYAFDAAVTAKKIRRDLNADGGSLDLHYKMSIGGADKAARMSIWICPSSKQA